ncbi:hypothetical protein KC330_g8066 [Hortaea werneckii]|nr:hypothetical protein KC330_g8066 [Hortaea werneckii]
MPPLPMFQNALHPAPPANAPMPKIFLDEEQERILNVVNTGKYGDMAEAFGAADQQYSPNYSISRINPSLEEEWEQVAQFLLLRLDRRVLKAILDNTLPRRALAELRNQVRRPPSVNLADNVDPVVYLNWIADQAGGGLTIAEFEQMLDVLEVVAGLSTRPGNPYAGRQPHFYARIKAAFAVINTGVFFIDELKSSAKANEYPNFQETVKQLVRYNRKRVLPRARQSQVDEIMIHAEAGWTSRFSQRAEDHKSMRKNSPPIFKFINCAVRALFPQRQFRMHQFAIFDIISAEEAAIAETLLSHAGATYAAYGGCNFDTAGVTTARVWSNGINWKDIAIRAADRGYLRHVESNQKAYEALLQRRSVRSQPPVTVSFLADKQQIEVQEQLSELKRGEESRQLRAEIDQSVQSLEIENAVAASEADKIDNPIRELATANDTMQQKAESEDNTYRALEKLGNGLNRIIESASGQTDEQEDEWETEEET